MSLHCLVFSDTRLVQALSIDPINGHILELLNLALESSSSRGLRDVGHPGNAGFQKAQDVADQKFTLSKSRAAREAVPSPAGSDDMMALT
jgi:anaphase-promoting complex subunit 6